VGRRAWQVSAVSSAGVSTFDALERFDVEWAHPLSRAALLDLAASRSFVITLAPDDRQALLQEMRAILDTHPALTGRDDSTCPTSPSAAGAA